MFVGGIDPFPKLSGLSPFVFEVHVASLSSRKRAANPSPTISRKTKEKSFSR